MATTPTYTGTPKTPYCQIGTANAGRDGSGTVGTLHTAGANGGRLNGIVFTATVTTTAGMVRIFVSNDGGTTKRLIGELAVSAITPSATVPAFTGTWTPPGGVLILAASAVVYVATEKAEAINAFGILTGDF